MKLKTIEIIGFKSFANRSKLHFPEGITAVVGPNGCGKTNVIEAIRWVLGEQNIRTLRGERMEEVVFNGTAQRKPLGMAEVRLFFSDPERRMGLEAEEFVVGRQIFRSGESNYFLNGTLCRLKDIQDLFMDTGMGSNAYSMIEPRMVESVLSDRAEERRFLFEEAAGIQKYKLRRKFALKKLESTEVDLQRINDIVGEVERTVGSLSRQVAKARRYQNLNEKLRRVAVTMAREELDRLVETEKPMLSRLAELKDELAGTIVADDTQAAAAEEIQTGINDAQRGADDLFNRLEKLNAAIRQGEDELTAIREKRAAGKDWIAESLARLENLKASISGRQEELESHSRQVETLRAAVGESEKEYQARQESAQIKNAAVNEARTQVNEVQARRDELVGKVASLAARAESLEDSAGQQKQRAGDLEAQALKFGETLALAQDNLAGLREKLNGIEEARKSLAASLEEKDRLLYDARRGAEELKERLAGSRLERDGLSGEMKLLEQLQKEMEGFGEGVRSLFLEGDRTEGIEAVAAEIFTTNPRFERAVEAALGLRIQSVITRDTGTVLEAIGRLKKSGTGSATFISRDLVNGYEAENGKIDGPILAYCEEVVNCKKEYEFLRKLLFSGIAIVDNLETAIKLQRNAERPLHLVTLGGETICQYAVSGGSETEKDSGATLLKRRRRIEEVSVVIEDLTVKVKALEEEIAASGVRLEELESENSESRNKLRSVDEMLGGLRADKTRLTLECENLLSRKESAEAEARAAAFQAGELAAQRDDVLSQAVEARENLEKIEAEIAAARSHLDVLEGEARLADTTQQDLSLRLAEIKARLGEMEKSYSLMERECAGELAESEKLESEISERKAVILRLDEREKVVRRALDEQFTQRSGLVAEKNDYEAELSGLREELQVIEAALREIRKKREAVNEARHGLELELERISSRRELVRRQVADNYGLDMAALEANFPFFPNDEEKEKGETADQGLLDELQERIRSLGPVNVLALEEYDREKERLDFLKKQRDDLVEARESLLRLVEEINKTARERFLATFAMVQDNFQEIFSSLFEGGQAHVSLLEENNPLESPIEVIARPRGKKMLGLNLLSGGEKALTALALLFAIYSVKPSPFCILDEVDAPLDDANIDRFLTIIRKFSQNTQFIIVTHNKRTMEAADCLYGVTMQEPGISKVVSVRIDQVGENSRIKEEAAAAQNYITVK